MTDKIVEAVKEAGVVGAGGAGFPTHVKIAAEVKYVIANGTECDPLLRCDQHLMTTHATEIVQGLRLVMQTSRAKRGVIALKEEYTEAVAALERAIRKYKDISLHLVGNFYPAGDEFVLVYEVLGRLVPETGLPLHVGAIVQNVGTLFNIALACNRIPVTHRHVTVTGAVKKPATLRVPIGTSVSEAIAWAGGIELPRWQPSISEDDFAIVAGGPMMGKVVDDPAAPVTKTTSGLIVLPKNNVVVRYLSRPLGSWVRRGRSTCDQCLDCTILCPRYLLGHNLRPHEIMRSINYGLNWPTEIVTAAVLCCECRLCEAYACPLELSPMAAYVEVKRQLAAQGWVNDRHKRTELTVHPMREYRRVPTHRLIARLGLTPYESYACPLDEREYEPQRVTIPLRQHLGASAQAVVKEGDAVERGALIAGIPEGKLGANVHASISGKVEAVTGEHIVITA
jgi:Na+-translocating ferredoxin:NAD+ oxidoreductase RnfC subunit